ncbi:MAG: hypothetical protein R2848_06265 [Thermomicrobiales bacterium]
MRSRRLETNLILSDGITYIHAVGVFDQASPDLSVRDLAEDWFTSVIVAEDVTEISPPQLYLLTVQTPYSRIATE